MKHKKQRVLHLYERTQYGCAYCQNVQHVKHGGCNRLACPFRKCPYKVLEKYDTYEEFMKSEDCKILVDGFFHTAASCYELSNGNAQVKQIFGGKEYRGFM